MTISIFSEPYQEQLILRYVGIFLAIISWILFAIAAYFVFMPLRSSMLIVMAFLFSTIWVAVHIIEIMIDKARRETESIISLVREKWVILNMIYILCLGVFSGWIDPVVIKGNYWPLIILNLFLIYDIVTSRFIFKQP